METMIAICLVVGAVICIATPFVSYVRAYDRGKKLWPQTFVRTYRVGEGAYRSMEVREERSVFAPPAKVDVVAATSAFLGMMWLPAAPFVALGLLVEGDGKGPGPVVFFGLTGMVLSVAILLTGPRLLERKNPRAARFVANWSILHNAILLGVIAYATSVFVFGAPDPIAMKHYELWSMYALEHVVGFGALLYALGSIAHAFYMRRAAKAILRDEEDSFSQLDPPAQEPACSSPSFQSSFAPPS
jgi:hypothetical protein